MVYKTAYLKIPDYDIMLDPEINNQRFKEVEGIKITIAKDNPWELGVKGKNLIKDSDLPWELFNESYDKTYETFRIPKHSGGYREICAPNDNLKAMQKQILHLLRDSKHILEHNAAHGFVKGRNCKTALKVHQANESRWFLKIDIHNFFPSWDVIALSRQLLNIINFKDLSADGMLAILKLATKDYYLTQGSPLSPYLTNLAMIPFDYHMTKKCTDKNIIYTRYADDMLFSCKERQPLENWESCVKETIDELRLPLTINESKTRLGSYAGRNWNLGIMYNQNHNLTVGYRAKHLMKVIIHKRDTLTPEELAHWKGVLAYYKSIEPDYFARFEL